MSTSDTNSPTDDVNVVATALQRAFAEVIAADIPADEKGKWHHRLLAITNMSKRDVARARRQLDRFHDEWNAREAGKDKDDVETDR